MAVLWFQCGLKEMKLASVIISQTENAQWCTVKCLMRAVEARLDKVKWNEKGLAVAIVQDADTREVLMQTVVNREILATNISSRKATFYNQWPLSLLAEGKIPSSFNIHNIKLSCNGDSLVYIGKPDGPMCHTCSGTCYHNSLLDSFNNHRAAQNRPPLATLYSLEPTITWLQQAKVETIVNGKPALMKQLMLNPMLLCSKIRKEVDELCQTLRDNEERSRTASKMADVYQAMALLRVGDLKLEGSVEVLRKQFLPVR
ncbi:PRA-CH domain-containing protein/PRA-PH domain-containing protein [Cinnamomum micranthum f. kanehirae]|uniref:phosphoribosyl-AMP cyclohydrolase n=1 Tax=Cinnamomum micranthum f. kanehirae TaxID=337451 RepID=A0A443NKH9_9MAGN|nr:PRA-CH domain-containing protein/PRA-PH domain-containing protein [Cinnamomum micranthum f. kanehirae]